MPRRKPFGIPKPGQIVFRNGRKGYNRGFRALTDRDTFNAWQKRYKKILKFYRVTRNGRP